jgi:RNA polymerase sigma-70 factor (ECF subfamily)
LLAVLDPDVVLRIDASAVPPGATRLIRGAPAVARQALLFSRRAGFTRPALVNGSVGMVVAPRGRLRLALGLTIADGKITEIDIIADPERLDRLDLAVLAD